MTSSGLEPVRSDTPVSYTQLPVEKKVEEIRRDIFKRGDTALDNNYIERIKRYISLSRRKSMFFGSHEGASRAAILYLSLIHI